MVWKGEMAWAKIPVAGADLITRSKKSEKGKPDWKAKTE